MAWLKISTSTELVRLQGKELRSDVSRLGYCGMANGNIVIGVSRSDRVKDYCEERGGSFFRQFILLSGGVVPSRFYLHGKVERRAIGRMADDHLYYYRDPPQGDALGLCRRSPGVRLCGCCLHHGRHLLHLLSQSGRSGGWHWRPGEPSRQEPPVICALDGLPAEIAHHLQIGAVDRIVQLPFFFSPTFHTSIRTFHTMGRSRFRMSVGVSLHLQRNQEQNEIDYEKENQRYEKTN